jgi:exonuclease VII large subunit
MIEWPWVPRRRLAEALEQLVQERQGRLEALAARNTLEAKVVRLAERFARLSERFDTALEAERRRYDRLAAEALAMKRQGFDHAPGAIEAPPDLELDQTIEEAIDLVAPEEGAVRRRLMGYALRTMRKDGADAETVAKDILTGADVDAITI